MKRYGKVVSHDPITGNGIIIDGKNKQFLFNKRIKKYESLSKRYVEFQISVESNSKITVNKISINKEQRNKASYELESKQIEFNFEMNVA